MDNEDKNPLASFFGVEESIEEVESRELTAIAELQSELDQDFEQARDNLQEVTILAKESMNAMSRLAKQMQTPGGYMALSKLMASVVMANKALLEIHKHKQDVDAPLVPTEITYNTLVMTTAEMQKRIESARDQANENLDEAE